MMETNPTKAMTDRERKIQVLDFVSKLGIIKDALLPEELADLRSLLEDLKKDEQWVKKLEAQALKTCNHLRDSGIYGGEIAALRNLITGPRP